MEIMNRELIYDILRVTLADGKVDFYGTLQEVSAEDWQWMYDVLSLHGVAPLVGDAITKLPEEMRPPKTILLKFIAAQVSCEQNYTKMGKLVANLDKFFTERNIKCLLLKGFNIAAYYPKPYLRRFVDLDLYAPEIAAEIDAAFIENGFEVEYDFYKHSHLLINGILVENHKCLLDSRGRRRQGERDDELKKIATRQLHRNEKMGLQYPIPEFSVVFNLHHALSHFIYEGISLKFIVDWFFFLRKEKSVVGSEKVRCLILKHNLMDFASVMTLICVKYLGLGMHEIPHYLQAGIKSVQPSIEVKFIEDLFRPYEHPQEMNLLRKRISLVRHIMNASWKPKAFLGESAFTFVIGKIIPILLGKTYEAD